MGKAYTSYFATVPSATTWPFVKFMRGMIKIRLGNAPVMRALVRRIKLDATLGSSSGGGGNGSVNAPYLVRNLSDLVTLIAAIATTDMTVLLNRGDRFRGATGFALNTAHFSLGAYGTGNRPVIEGFAQDDGTSWALNASTNWYDKTVVGTVNWVRLQEDSATNLEAGTETVFTARTSAANIGTNNNSWFWVANTLSVRVGANANPATTKIDICQAAGYGVRINDVDDVRIDNIVCNGWGMNGVAPQTYNILSVASGSNEHVISNCGGYYGGHHIIGHLGSGTQGGITTWSNCDYGLGKVDGSGQYTGFVAFADTGTHEVILHDYDCLYGALPDAASVGWDATTLKRGQPFYGHTGNGTDSFGLALCFLGRTRNHTYGCQFNGYFGSCPAYTTNRAKLSEYRAWIIGDKFEASDQTNLGMGHINTVVLWCNYSMKVVLGSTGSFFLATPVQAKAAYIGCSITIDWSNIAAAASTCKWNGNPTDDQYLDFAYCGLFNINTPANYYVWDANTVIAPYRGPRVRFFNSIWHVSTGANLGAWNACPNAPTNVAAEAATADASITGGGLANAFFKSGTAGPATVYGPGNFSSDYLGHDLHTGYVDMVTAPVPGAVPASGGELYGLATTALPYSVEWWFDHTNKYIYDMPKTKPDIGPVQHSFQAIVKDYRNRRAAFLLKP